MACVGTAKPLKIRERLETSKFGTDTVEVTDTDTVTASNAVTFKVTDADPVAVTDTDAVIDTVTEISHKSLHFT